MHMIGMGSLLTKVREATGHSVTLLIIAKVALLDMASIKLEGSS